MNMMIFRRGIYCRNYCTSTRMSIYYYRPWSYIELYRCRLAARNPEDRWCPMPPKAKDAAVRTSRGEVLRFKSPAEFVRL